jgi:hypothetical protein
MCSVPERLADLELTLRVVVPVPRRASVAELEGAGVGGAAHRGSIRLPCVRGEP